MFPRVLLSEQEKLRLRGELSGACREVCCGAHLKEDRKQAGNVLTVEGRDLRPSPPLDQGRRPLSWCLTSHLQQRSQPHPWLGLLLCPARLAHTLPLTCACSARRGRSSLMTVNFMPVTHLDCRPPTSHLQQPQGTLHWVVGSRMEELLCHPGVSPTRGSCWLSWGSPRTSAGRAGLEGVMGSLPTESSRPWSTVNVLLEGSKAVGEAQGSRPVGQALT